MSIKMLWGNPTKTILHQIYSEPFDLSEWYEAVSQTCVMLNDVQHSVNMILDLLAVDNIPIDWLEVLSYSKSHYHVNQSQHVMIVKPDHLKPVQVLLNSRENIYKMAIVTSREEAKQLLAKSAHAAMAS